VWTPLAFAIILGSVGLGVWCLASGARGRYLNQPQYSGLLVLAAIVLVQSVVAAVRLVAGDRPSDVATFVGYLLTAALLMPAGVWMARAEPTRWGSVIAGAAALVVAVLTLRCLQVWSR
jgi:hypothetical protein